MMKALTKSQKYAFLCVVTYLTPKPREKPMRVFFVTESGTQKGILVQPPAGQLIRDAYVRVGYSNGTPQGVAVHPSVAKVGETFYRAELVRTKLERELRLMYEQESDSPDALVLIRIARGTFRKVVWLYGSRRGLVPDRRMALLMHGYEFLKNRSHLHYRLLIMRPGATLCVLQRGGEGGLTRELHIDWDGAQIGFQRNDAKPAEQLELPRIS